MSLAVDMKSDALVSEMAAGVARHFEAYQIAEEDCISGFFERLHKGDVMPTDHMRQTAYYDGQALPIQARKRKRHKMAARPGEQVAAKVTRTDENGSWILASVQKFYEDSDNYDVQDEDDTSKLIRLPWTHVMRIATGLEGALRKGSECMAIFPETTSFYRAKVSQDPIWKVNHSGTPSVSEIIVKFEDDEDASGRTPHRRVPARYVIPLPQDYFFDDEDDIDLNPRTSH